MLARPHRISVLAPLFALLIMLSAGMAAAQQPGSTGNAESGGDSSETTVQDLEDLVQAIEDPERRAQLLEQLRGLIEARQSDDADRQAAGDDGGLFAALSDQVDQIGDQLAAAANALASIDQLWSWGREQITDPGKRADWVAGLWKVLAALAAGLIAEFILVMLLRRTRRRLEDRVSDGVLMRILYLLLRTVVDIIPIGGFAVAAYAALPVLEPSNDASRVALAIILASVLARAIRAAARMILAPKAGGLRLFSMSNRTAQYLFVWAGRVTNVSVYGYFAAEVALSLGLPLPAFNAFLNLLGVIVAGMLIVFIMQNRRDVAAWLRGETRRSADETGRHSFQPLMGVRRRLADIWHILASLYVLASLFVWLLRIGGGFVFLASATGMTVLIIALAWLLHGGAQRLLGRALRIDPELKARDPELEVRANRYLPMLRSGVTVITVIIALLGILQVWGADVIEWLRSEPGRNLLASLGTILLIIVGALIVWELASSAIQRFLMREEARSDADRRTRLQTLLPLARNALLVILVIMVTMTILSELGVDIGPLLAGAGVIGLAIGFGAQSLVKDVITGIFNLIEDTVAVDDIVDLGGGHLGVVEAVTIRSVRLRDYSGVVHTVPFGEVTSVENYTKDYANAVLDIGVAYRESIDEVMEVMREIASGMREDEDWKASIYDDLEMAGVNELADSAVVVRARIRVAPGMQWGVKREYFRRIKAAFDERGIEIPFPHVTLWFGEDKDGLAPPGPVRLIQEGKGPRPGESQDGGDGDGEDEPEKTPEDVNKRAMPTEGDE